MEDDWKVFGNGILYFEYWKDVLEFKSNFRSLHQFANARIIRYWIDEGANSLIHSFRLRVGHDLHRISFLLVWTLLFWDLLNFDFLFVLYSDFLFVFDFVLNILLLFFLFMARFLFELYFIAVIALLKTLILAECRIFLYWYRFCLFWVWLKGSLCRAVSLIITFCLSKTLFNAFWWLSWCWLLWGLFIVGLGVWISFGGRELSRGWEVWLAIVAIYC